MTTLPPDAPPKRQSRGNSNPSPATRFKPGSDSRRKVGRSMGSMNRRSAEFLAEAKRRGVVPLEVMLEAIEHFQERARQAAEENNPSAQDQFVLQSVEVAQCAAPYCHAKLKISEKTTELGERAERALLLGRFTNEELLMRLRTKVVEHQPLKLVQGD